MNRLVLIALAATCLSSGAFAGLSDTFSYPDGPLTTGSGGAWKKWVAGSGDAVVSGGQAVINHTTDVIREFGNELQTAGSMVSFSFDVNIAQANTANEYYMFFSPASAPYDTGQNYGESLGFVFDWGTDPGGNSNVYAWPSNPNNFIYLIGTITPGSFHTIAGTMTKSAGSIAFSANIDGGTSLNGSFNHTDARGINGIEMYQGAGTGDNGFRVDNLQMVPEPATMATLALGALALMRRRKR